MGGGEGKGGREGGRYAGKEAGERRREEGCLAVNRTTITTQVGVGPGMQTRRVGRSEAPSGNIGFGVSRQPPCSHCERLPRLTASRLDRR